MPRKSRLTKPGVRKYGVKSNYTPETLEKALDKIKSGALSRMEASKEYKIPPVTLFYKLKEKHLKSVGRPVTLSKDEEDSFKSHLLILSDVGIPISMLDFRVIVKKYLDKNNRQIKQFKNNMPGYEWGSLFLERHPDLKIKVAHNIPRKRAQVNREQVEGFFDNLSKEIEGIPPENIFNMDESGFHDDPGKKKLLFRRDSRHPEIIKNATKSCYTVVFCVNAAGETLPPFFVFKGKKLWSDWLFQAPQGSRMAVSDSGWITTEVFEEWLEKHFIPRVSNLEGKKMLLCDNLSAHISPKALHLCEQHNIVFICLIPNSTHLVQPLDVGYFSAVKSNWRKVLDNYRQTSRGKKVMSLPKSLFAQLLRKTLEIGEPTRVDNIKAGFRSCGLFPFSPQTVLNKLPSYTSEVETRESVGEAFHSFIEEVRTADLNGMTRGKKFQLPVIAGKSVSAEDVEKYYEEKAKSKTSLTQNKESNAPSKKRGRPAGSKNKKKKKVTVPEEAETNTETNISDSESIIESNVRITVEAEIHGIEKSTSTLEKNGPQRNKKTRIEDVIQEIEDDIEEDLSQEILNSANNYLENQEECAEELTFIQEYVVSSDGILLETHETSNSTEKGQLDGFANGMFCVFKEEGSLFPGCINKVGPEKITVSVLQKNYLGGWSWYSRNERCEIKKGNVVSILKEHQITRKDGNIFIEDEMLSMEWGE